MYHKENGSYYQRGQVNYSFLEYPFILTIISCNNRFSAPSLHGIQPHPFGMKQLLLLCLIAMSSFWTKAQFPGCPDVDAGVDQTTVCPGVCTTLTAQPIVSGLTTSYTVSPINYTPPIAFNAPGGTPISVATDDVWSPNIQLPFNFCYYGQTYTSCHVGSNGAIRLGNTNANSHPWQFSNAVPSNDLVQAGNVFGIYHDIDPSVPVAGGGIVKWYLLGAAPCRIFVVSFYEMAHFSCNNLRSTHMMVLYETTNVIDVYVEKKQTCNNWNSGRAVIGIQNINGSQGIAAPGRNTGPWSVFVPEAWRFSPAGTPTYTVRWYNGNQLISNNLTVEVCPNTSTTYTASVTYIPCAGGNEVTVTDDVVVNVNQGVVPSFTSANTSYCQSSVIPNLPTTSLNGISGSWSPALNNQQTTTYTFTPNPGQCASQVERTISVTPLQTPNFSLQTTYCAGENINALPTISNNGISGTWSPTLNNQQTSTYTFVPNTGQCAITSQTTIQINPFVAANFENVPSYCFGAAVPNLPNTSLNGVSGTWSPPINNQETTIYTFTPNPGSCLIGSPQITIAITNNIVPQFNNPSNYCENSTIPELPTSSINNIQGSWTPAINNQQTTSYTFTATDQGCFTNASLTIEILPILESWTLHSHCESELPYFWNGQALVQTGLYEANFSSSYGCDSIAKIDFSVIPKLESTTIVDLCAVELPYLWNGLNINTGGSHQITLTSSIGCDSIAYLSLNVWQSPTVSFEASITSGCGSLLSELQITSSDPYVEALWTSSDGQLSNDLVATSLQFNQAGCFDVALRLTNQYGCTAEVIEPDYICVYPNPIASFVVNPSQLDAYNQTAKFINLSSNADTYFWNFDHNNATSNSLSPTYTYPDNPYQYQVWLIAENSFGCIDSTFQIVGVNNGPVYYIPNSFTPDGDQFNGLFLPIFSSGFDPYRFNMLIFDRWGEVLFESNNSQVGWDGTYGGILMQDGVYLYKINFRDAYTDKRYDLTGHVNLIR